MLYLITFTVLPLHEREWTYRLTPKLAHYHTRYWLQSPSHRNQRINPPSRFSNLDMMLSRNRMGSHNHHRNAAVNCTAISRLMESLGLPLYDFCTLVGLDKIIRGRAPSGTLATLAVTGNNLIRCVV